MYLGFGCLYIYFPFWNNQYFWRHMEITNIRSRKRFLPVRQIKQQFFVSLPSRKGEAIRLMNLIDEDQLSPSIYKEYGSIYTFVSQLEEEQNYEIDQDNQKLIINLPSKK